MDEEEARRVLGVDADASPERIRTMYRQMLKDWHPDFFAGNAERSLEGENQTRRIITAYRLLSRAPSSDHMPLVQFVPEPLWNQWNPFHPSHYRYGPNTVWDTVAIIGVIVVVIVIGLVFGG